MIILSSIKQSTAAKQLVSCSQSSINRTVVAQLTLPSIDSLVHRPIIHHTSRGNGTLIYPSYKSIYCHRSTPANHWPIYPFTENTSSIKLEIHQANAHTSIFLKPWPTTHRTILGTIPYPWSTAQVHTMITIEHGTSLWDEAPHGHWSYDIPDSSLWSATIFTDSGLSVNSIYLCANWKLSRNTRFWIALTCSKWNFRRPSDGSAEAHLKTRLSQDWIYPSAQHLHLSPTVHSASAKVWSVSHYLHRSKLLEKRLFGDAKNWSVWIFQNPLPPLRNVHLSIPVSNLSTSRILSNSSEMSPSMGARNWKCLIFLLPTKIYPLKAPLLQTAKLSRKWNIPTNSLLLKCCGQLS